MKEMNRRAFLTLTGAAVAMMALAACGDEPYAPPAPPAPPAPTTSKEAELVAAINKVWKEKYDAKAVVHEQLTLNQDAVDAIRCYGHVFEEVNETPHKLTSSDFGIVLRESGGQFGRYGRNLRTVSRYGGGSGGCVFLRGYCRSDFCSKTAEQF